MSRASYGKLPVMKDQLDKGELVSKSRKDRLDIIKVRLPPPPLNDQWMAASTAADEVGLSHVVVWKWAQRNILPSKRSGKFVLVPLARVRQLAEIWHKHGKKGRHIFRANDPNHAYIPMPRGSLNGYG